MVRALAQSVAFYVSSRIDARSNWRTTPSSWSVFDHTFIHLVGHQPWQSLVATSNNNFFRSRSDESEPFTDESDLSEPDGLKYFEFRISLSLLRGVCGKLAEQTQSEYFTSSLLLFRWIIRDNSSLLASLFNFNTKCLSSFGMMAGVALAESVWNCWNTCWIAGVHRKSAVFPHQNWFRINRCSPIPNALCQVASEPKRAGELFSYKESANATKFPT